MAMGSVTALTPADLLRMGRPPDGKHYELTGAGELIVVGNAGPVHELVKAEVLWYLITGVPRSVGRVFAETQFTILRGARIPDVALVLTGRLEEIDAPTSIAPDLAIEIISESEKAGEAELKLQEYLAGGVREVWQMYPELKLVRVHTPEGCSIYKGEETLTSRLLPAFSVKVCDLFPAITMKE